MEVTLTLTTCPIVLLILLFVITFFVILWFGIKALQLIWKYCLAYYCGAGAKWKGGPNTWAVITGATDGIGLAYAKAMAEKGYQLVLMSRSPDKLNKVKNEIHKQFPNCQKIKTIVVDFFDTDVYDNIELELKELGEIHVLINNVGMTYKHPEFFTRLEDRDEFITRIFNINCNAMTRLLSIILPQMVHKKSGIVLNICSYSACFPTPLLSLYSATKIYGDYLSRALAAEYAYKGIIIQSVLPYYVSTNMIRNPKHSFMIPSSDRFVRSALKTVGIESRTYGYLPHTLIAFFTNYLLKFLVGNDINTKLAFRKMIKFREAYVAKRSQYMVNFEDSAIDIRL